MDVDKVAQMAKDVILKTGELPTCLFVEMDSTDMVIVGVVGEDDTAYKRGLGMFLAGRGFAGKKLKKRRITGLAHAAEVWVTTNIKYRGRASADPNRKEVLSITCLEDISAREPLQQKALSFELIRGQGGQLIDLLREDEEAISCLGLPTAAFLAGARTAKQDYSLAIHAYRQLLERYSVLLDQTEQDAS